MSTRTRLLTVAAGLVAPFLVALAMVPLRDNIANANVALILAAVVVGVASTGERSAAVLAALSGGLWFDFFHTLPYQSLRINSSDDITTAVVLLIVGVAVGEIAVRSRRHRGFARRRAGEIRTIHALAELAAAGEVPGIVAMEVAGELRNLLSLTDCRFEPGSEWEDEKRLPRLERGGQVVWGELRWGAHQLGFPAKQTELLVQGGGRTYGRFLMTQSYGVPVPIEDRVVAVALADQAGAAYAAWSSDGGEQRHPEPIDS